MARSGVKRERWTLSFDPGLKAFLVKTAKRRRICPVTLLEEIVKEKFNPYGHTDVKDSVAYVRMLRRRSRGALTRAFKKRSGSGSDPRPHRFRASRCSQEKHAVSDGERV